MEEKRTCFNCEHYTNNLGSDGYCKYYRHYISSEDIICSSYVKSDNVRPDLHKVDYTDATEMPTIWESGQDKSDKNKYLKIMDFLLILCCSFMIVIASLLGLLLVNTLCKAIGVSFIAMELYSVAAVLLIAVALIALFLVGRRIRIVRFLLIFLAVALFLIFLHSREEILLSWQDFITHVLATDFGVSPTL